MNILITEDTDEAHPVHISIPEIESERVSRLSFLIKEKLFTRLHELRFIDSKYERKVVIEADDKVFITTNFHKADSFVIYFKNGRFERVSTNSWNEENRKMTLLFIE